MHGVSQSMASQGIRVVLTSAEGSRLFVEQLALAGVVEREICSIDGNRWSLLVLDRAFDYQVQDQQTKAFSGFEVKRILIRSRWAGYSVGDPTPTSVFVLITGDDHSFDDEEIDPKKFYFVAWAMCKNENAG